MTDVVLGLGSNLGNRLGNLRAAIALLEQRGIRVRRRSGVWESAPVPPDQPRFLNAVVEGVTELSAPELLVTTSAVERELGRRKGRRWGPRPIDIDILYYGPQVIDTDDLRVPHPRIGERAFVLEPLLEVLPLESPLRAEMHEALRAIGSADVNRTGSRL